MLNRLTIISEKPFLYLVVYGNNFWLSYILEKSGVLIKNGQ